VVCRTVPALSDYIEGKNALGQLRDVQIEDLLGREPIVIDLEGIRERIEGRTVLVTGAGGSIGSELCRQVARFHPGALVALDHCENRLCYLGLDLGETSPELKLVQVVGDIRDERGMRDLLARHRPQIVFHAAAHKHVHFLEVAPREAILNNILGTRHVAEAAASAGVETFVFISTDKAVNPSNVMGASKRACEILLQSMAAGCRTTFAAVRFGNVLGSDGSVLPIFKRQLGRGGPLTVTHPEVRRYFMTIPEASQLVIQAALFGAGGDVFVLDMGEQVRILDVAEQLIHLSGLRPGLDVQIRFVGLRPGEKLEEELLTDTERTRSTRHRKILQLELDPVDPAAVRRQVDHLAMLAAEGNPEQIRFALSELVPEYRARAVEPLPPIVRIAEPPIPATAPVVAVRRADSASKRLADIAASALLLSAALPVTLVALALYRLAGPGEIRLLRDEIVGRNRRVRDRRTRQARVSIDRRDQDRRARALPGHPFPVHRLALARGSGRAQEALASWLSRYRIDRALLLWNVLRGQMSFVGPAPRPVSRASAAQDRTTPWIFARPPGLASPGAVAAKAGELRLGPEHYDGYYSRVAGARLDADILMHSVARWLRGEETSPDSELPVEAVAGSVSSSREGLS
jgi:nucleoside-diphosphate-sugar epimerase/lipopolysaccharide/colanic/teichoic acid biosynthesis glycosyltransferase